MFGLKAKEKKEPRRIGETLVTRQLLRAEDIDEALQQQRRCGARIGEVLLGQGKISAYLFYQVLAEHLEKPFVDLDKEPCDEVLLEREERHLYLEHQLIPWKKKDKTIVLAVCDITPELERWAEEKYGKYDFVVTSPFDIYWTVQRCFAADDDEDARELLWNNAPQKSARQMFFSSKVQCYAVAAAIMAIFVLFFHSTVTGFFIAINSFYLATLLFKVMFFCTGYWSLQQKEASEKRLHILDHIDDNELPIYTILVPLYKEKQRVIERLVSSLRGLDYPKSRLDVKLIVEEDDTEVIEAIKSLRCERYFEIIRVPYSLPRTKPKACNYALKFARGEYVTIYDAEDRPGSMQLRKVLQTFRQSPPDVVCVQAKLNYYNREENLLTRMFSIEYSSWFNFMLPGLELLRIPIPLGGTSNHFSVAKLRELHAWDPYNVTEDADLGIRLAQHGYRTAIVDSLTLEEAPVSLGGWMKQRSRWLKGYMQTYIVHMREPAELYRTIGMHGLLGFLFFVGAPTMVFLSAPIVMMLSFVAFSPLIALPDWFLWFALSNVCLGVLTHIMVALMVLRYERWHDMLLYAFLFPFYWILHIAASFRALHQLITRPHFWDKTEHGVSQMLISQQKNAENL